VRLLEVIEMLPMPASFLSFLLLAPAVDGWVGIYLDPEREEAVVGEVIPDSPAAKAGLQPGDVLLSAGGKPTPTREQFAAVVAAAKAGDRLSVEIRRAGQSQTVVVRLGKRPDAPVSGAVTDPKPARPQSPSPGVEPAPGQPRGFLGVSIAASDEGLRVERVVADGPAARAGLQAGDLVTRIGDVAVADLADLEAALAHAVPGTRVAIGLRSDAGARSVTVVLGSHPDGAANRSNAGPGAVAPAPAQSPSSRAATPPPAGGRDIDAEIAALRAELAELRKQVEALRQAGPRK
jgi:S1-C subfamily serine protease